MLQHQLTFLLLLLLLLLLLAPTVVLASTWHVNIDSITVQTINFSTGSDSGSAMNVEVYDKCRTESSDRFYQGELFPASSVNGIAVDTSGVVNNPGDGNSISISFAEGISDNSDIYTDHGDNTATVEFCVQVGLYYSGTLANFAEAKLTYTIDLTTSYTSLSGYTVTEAAAFQDAADVQVTFDGNLDSYFCNPFTYDEIPNDGTVTHQGSIIHVCFKVPNGQFEVADIIDLSIIDAVNQDPTQVIVSNSVIVSPTYAEKQCYDWDDFDTNVCVVSFLLRGEFFDHHTLTLSGSGSVLLEFGDAAGSRRTRQLQEEGTIGPQQGRLEHTEARAFMVKASEFVVEQVIPIKKKDTAINGSFIIAGIITVSVICMAVIAKTAVRVRANYAKTVIKDRYLMKQKFHESEGCLDFATAEADTFRDCFLVPPHHESAIQAATTSPLVPETSVFSMLGERAEESSRLMEEGSARHDETEENLDFSKDDSQKDEDVFRDCFRYPGHEKPNDDDRPKITFVNTMDNEDLDDEEDDGDDSDGCSC